MWISKVNYINEFAPSALTLKDIGNSPEISHYPSVN
jgi:hypothetical protein